MNSSREASQDKLWKCIAVHQKLNFCVLKIALLKKKKTRLWWSSEAEYLKKLWQEHQKQKEFTSLKNWQNQNQWLKNNLLKDSVISTGGNIRWYNVNLIHKWSAFEDCTIVLLLLKMVEWYFKLQGSRIGFPYQRRQCTAINCTNKFQLAPYLSATVITLHSSINRRLKWKKWLPFYYCV